MTTDRIADIQERLRSLGDELEDAAIDLLRTAVEDGAKGRPPEEKQLMAARRAVMKAVKSLDL